MPSPDIIAAISPALLDPRQLVTPVIWVRSDLGTNVSATTGRLTSWVDQSGRGNSFIPAGANGPTYVASDPQYNGLPSFAALATNNAIKTSAALTYGAFTRFIVAKFSPVLANGYFMTRGDGVSFADALAGFTGVTDSFVTRTVNGVAVSTGGNIPGANWTKPLIWTQTYGGTSQSQTLRQNGVNKALNPIFIGEPGLGSCTGLAFVFSTVGGASFFSTGSVAEIIIYDRVLSDLEISNVENYLSLRYAISIS